MPGLSKNYGTDHTSTYLTDWLNFAGIHDVTDVWFYGSKMRGEAETKAAFEKAQAEAHAAALR